MHACVRYTIPYPTNPKVVEVNPSSISLFVNPSDSMRSGVHESLVGFRFVHGDVIKCILN